MRIERLKEMEVHKQQSVTITNALAWKQVRACCLPLWVFQLRAGCGDALIIDAGQASVADLAMASASYTRKVLSVLSLIYYGILQSREYLY